MEVVQVPTEHVHQKDNFVIDWVAYFIARYFGDILWTAVDFILVSFKDILYFNFIFIVFILKL